MANIKISELEEITTLADDDVLPIVDTSENETKKIKKENFIGIISENVYGVKGVEIFEIVDDEQTQETAITEESESE